MLRIISLFLLLIISRVSFAETVDATQSATYSSTLYSSKSDCSPGWCTYTEFLSSVKALGGNYSEFYSDTCAGFSPVFQAGVNKVYCNLSTKLGYFQFYAVATPSYSCPSGYTRSDSVGNVDSSGSYCTKNSCQDLYQTSTLMEIPAGQTVTNACFGGCSASLYEGGSWSCPSSSVACAIRVQFDGNSCSGGVDYAPNASSSDSGSDSDSPPPPPPCSAGSTTGTVNGETVTTCADDGTDSPPITDPSGSTSPPASGSGSTVGSPENTSGTQNSTVGGGTGSLGGSGYGEGGSTGSGGTSGGDTGSGGTSGGDTGSGGTSGGDTGSGGTSGGDTGSGGTSGGDTGSGGTSGGDTGSGGTSGGDTGSGGTSGGGTGSGTGDGSFPSDQTSAADSTCPEGSDSVACATMDSLASDDLPSVDAGWGFTQQSAFGGADNASCPASIVVMTGVDFSFENLCSFFQRMRPFVLGIAWLIAAYIATGSRNTSGGDD